MPQFLLSLFGPQKREARGECHWSHLLCRKGVTKWCVKYSFMLKNVSFFRTIELKGYFLDIYVNMRNVECINKLLILRLRNTVLISTQSSPSS